MSGTAIKYKVFVVVCDYLTMIARVITSVYIKTIARRVKYGLLERLGNDRSRSARPSEL